MNAVLGGTLVVGSVFIALNLLSDLAYPAARPANPMNAASPSRLADERAAGFAPAGRAGAGPTPAGAPSRATALRWPAC